MLDRRCFTGLLLSLPAGRALGQARQVPFYNSTGPELSIQALDAAAATLRPLGAVTLPANVQYAWAAGGFLYVASSDGGPGAIGTAHAVTSFRIAADGTLTAAGASLPLTARPIHLSAGNDGRFLLVAYNNPSHVTVHRIGGDGLPGPALPQPQDLDFGIYGHQVRMTPGGRSVVLVTRGNDPAGGNPEDPGALKLFRFQDGRLSNLASVAPGTGSQRGFGFGPRHLDFHPSLPRAYVSLERENMMFVYGLAPDGGFSRDPLFTQATLADPGGKARHPGQGVGPIHVHPRGHVVYIANRGSGTVSFQGQRVSNGGENSIAVFALDRTSGAPTHLQSIDAHGFETRTFSIDPTGTLLVAASQSPMMVREGGGSTRVSAGLSFFRIQPDGRLGFLHKQDVDTAKGTQFWCGFLTMP